MISQSKIVSIILAVFVSQAFCDDLTCYVCNDCAQITKETPLVACNAGFFSDPTTTTTMASKISTTTEVTMDASMPTTTTTSTISSTTSQTTEAFESVPESESTTTTTTTKTTTTSTETPRKNFESTDAIETTMNPAAEMINITGSVTHNSNDTTAPPLIISTNETDSIPAIGKRSYTNSTEFRVRQVRSLINTDISYQCYSIETKNDNGTMNTERGCSRIVGNEQTCSQLGSSNSSAGSSKCNACSKPQCNGSSLIEISIATLLISLVAGFLGRN